MNSIRHIGAAVAALTGALLALTTASVAYASLEHPEFRAHLVSCAVAPGGGCCGEVTWSASFQGVRGLAWGGGP